MVVSYGMKIKKENRIFERTIQVYRKAVSYIMQIVLLHYDEIASIPEPPKATLQQARQGYVDQLIHSTQGTKAKYPKFDKEFCKFPSYFRRGAINEAIGNIFAYKSQLSNWEKDGRKGRRPFLRMKQNCMPSFYNGNMFLQDGRTVQLKLYNGKDWIWHTMEIRDTDFRYALKNVSDWKQSSPVLVKCGHRYELRVAYGRANKTFPKYVCDKNVTTAIGVDLGINTDAVCSVVHNDGTVTGQKFINCPVEKDRMFKLLNVIKKAQRNGNYKNPRLWRFVNNYNSEIAIRVSTSIVNYALENNAQVIVFEFLEFSGRKRGSKKQRLSLWRKREIQRRTEALCRRCGIRVSYICAVNSSRLAYDGSGRITRGTDAGFRNNQLCRFQNGKVYNCDLSASKNIGARYFIRVYLKTLSEKKTLLIQAKVPEISKRTSCTLATLIDFHAELCTLKAGKTAA